MKPIGVPKSITLEQSESIKRYLAEIKHYRTLTREEELDLLTRCQAGDEVAREKILKHNLKFVVSAAKRYQHGYGHMILVDLIQLGNIGLMKAVDRYDLQSGNKFISFAVWWIRQSIMVEMGQYNAVIYFPHNYYLASSKIRAFKDKYEQLNGYEPSTEQIEDFIRVADRKVLQYGEIYTNRFTYLDKPIASDSSAEMTFGDFIEDPNTDAPDAQLELDDNSIIVKKLLDCLSERDRKIMTSHYGIDGVDSKRAEQIADECSMTAVRVRQIIAKSQIKMRESAEALKYNPEKNR